MSANAMRRASAFPESGGLSNPCEQREAIQRAAKQGWIASSQVLLAMTARIKRRARGPPFQKIIADGA
jgi:hypothetical protein